MDAATMSGIQVDCHGVGRYRGFPLADLEHAFSAIQPKDDWREPIEALIPPDAFNLMAAAVAFFTATGLEVVGGPEPLTGRILVRSIGYRAGPAGNH